MNPNSWGVAHFGVNCNVCRTELALHECEDCGLELCDECADNHDHKSRDEESEEDYNED